MVAQIIDTPTPATVFAWDLAEGEAAEIVEYTNGSSPQEKVGRVVVRCGDRIQSIGYHGYWDSVIPERKEFLKLRRLPPGTQIQIVANS